MLFTIPTNVPRMWHMNIKNIVKNNAARFSFYRASLEDLGTATLLAEHKAITLMRYIRKALEDHTFVKA